MAFKKRTWIDRLVEFPGRRKLKNIVDGQSATYDVERAEGIVSAEGDDFAADDMNDLEQRIADGISAVEKAIPKSLPANGGTAEKVSHALKFSGASTETYDGSADKTVNIPTYTNFGASGTGAKAGLVPSPGGTQGATRYLREDGSWQKPPDNNTWTPMKGATSTANGSVGYVNAAPPMDGYNTKYLRADGSWQIPPNTNTWKQNTASSEGYVAAGGTTHANQVWKCDGSGVPGWRTDANTTYSAFTKSTTSAAGKAGLVPAPPTTPATTHYLREDGTWAIPQNTAALTAGRALVSDSAGKVGVSAVTSTELGYLDGVTSNLQAQINKLSETIDTLNSNLGDYKTATKLNIPVAFNTTETLVTIPLQAGVWIVSSLIWNDGQRLCSVSLTEGSGNVSTFQQITFSQTLKLANDGECALNYKCYERDVSTVPIATISAVRIK